MSPLLTVTATDPATGLKGTLSAPFTISAPTPPQAVFGTSLGPVPAGDHSITDWTTTVARPMAVRHYFAAGTIWPSYTASPFRLEAGVRKILCDFELATDGSDKAAFDAFLGSCAQAGLAMDITIYHAAPSKAGWTQPAQYWNALKPYVPIVVKHGYRHIYDLNSYQDVHDGLLAAWWPGDSVHVDAIGIEYYSQGYIAGQRMDASAAFADSKGVAFGLTEFGMNCTEAQGNAMIGYIHGLYAARIAAGKPCYDIVTWNNVTGNFTQPVTGQPASWVTGYRGLADLLATS